MNAVRTPNVDREHFRSVAGRFATGVAVLTSRGVQARAGMTVSALTSLSLDPPMVLVCVNRSVPTERSVAEAGTFCLNILGEGQEQLALQFARPGEDKFTGVRVHEGVLGNPVLTDALASIECEVSDTVQAGSHSIFIGRARDAQAREGLPLTYFRGGFGGLTLDRFNQVYQRLRDMILAREIDGHNDIDVPQLARRLDVEPAAVLAGLSTLRREGLITSTQYGHRVAPFTADDAAEAFEARAIIEKGVADLTVGSVSEDDLAVLDQLCSDLSRFILNDEFTDFEAYLEANDRFHRFLIGLSGNRRTIVQYEALAIPTIMAHSFGMTRKSSSQFVDVHQRIVSGYRRRDLSAVKAAIVQYTTLATERARELLTSHGGSV
ncbi:flavin reductase [Dactylosporangium sp. NPDC000521]|uniref:flavin reductase n=1 Tax=Dactylosporangium sp. NPDC000521 TaxID=3363975 RepID=UPI00367F4844